MVLPSSKPAYELDFERLVEELLRQVQAPFTGTLFISSDDGEKGRVGFERGHILGLSWGSTQGEAALDRLRVAGRFRVTPSVHVVFSTPHSLPSTFDILRGLMARRGASVPPSEEVPSGVRPAGRDSEPD